MSAMRMVFLSFAALILTGIWLTGFKTAHWFLYLPAAAMLFAGISGICPGYMLYRKLGFKGQIPGSKV